jgi:hypothetical protein
MSARIATVTIPMSRETVVCGVQSCTREGKCTESCICIGCAEPIPISIQSNSQETRMTTEQNIASLRASLRKTGRDAVPRTRVSLEKPFDLVGQFSAATVAAVNAKGRIILRLATRICVNARLPMVHRITWRSRTST